MRVGDVTHLIVRRQIANSRHCAIDCDDDTERSIQRTYSLTHFHDDTPSASCDRCGRIESTARQRLSIQIMHQGFFHVLPRALTKIQKAVASKIVKLIDTSTTLLDK